MKKLCKDAVVDKLHYCSIDELKQLREYIIQSIYDEKQAKLDFIKQKHKNLKR